MLQAEMHCFRALKDPPIKFLLRHFILYLTINVRKKFVFQCMSSYGLWVEIAGGLNLSWNVNQEKTLLCKEICMYNMKLCTYRQWFGVFFNGKRDFAGEWEKMRFIPVPWGSLFLVELPEIVLSPLVKTRSIERLYLFKQRSFTYF